MWSILASHWGLSLHGSIIIVVLSFSFWLVFGKMGWHTFFHTAQTTIPFFMQRPPEFSSKIFLFIYRSLLTKTWGNFVLIKQNTRKVRSQVQQNSWSWFASYTSYRKMRFTYVNAIHVKHNTIFDKITISHEYPIFNGFRCVWIFLDVFHNFLEIYGVKIETKHPYIYD